MSQEPIFSWATDALLEYLRGELTPTVLSSPDMIRLAYPGQEEEYRLGLYLHDVEEVRPNGPPSRARLGGDTHKLPDLMLALHFMAFANRKVAFNSMEMLDELVMIEAVHRAVHDGSGLEVGGQKLKLEFQPLTRGEKGSIWQSVNTPLQPAAYFTVEPVLLPSGKIQRIPPVKEVDIRTGRVERRSASP